MTAGMFAMAVLGPITGSSSSATCSMLPTLVPSGQRRRRTIGMVPISVLSLLLVASIGLVEEGGMMRRFMDLLDRTIARSARGAEMAIVAMISFANLLRVRSNGGHDAVGRWPTTPQTTRIAPQRKRQSLDTISWFVSLRPAVFRRRHGRNRDQRDVVNIPICPVVSCPNWPYIFYGCPFPLMSGGATGLWTTKG